MRVTRGALARVVFRGGDVRTAPARDGRPHEMDVTTQSGAAAVGHRADA